MDYKSASHKFSIFSTNLQTADTNLMPGLLGQILQEYYLGKTKKLLQKREVRFSDEVLVDIDVIVA